MRTEEIEEMRKLPLFAGVAPAQGEAMLKPAFLQRFPPHVDLVHEGEPADFLHVVVEGQVLNVSGFLDDHPGGKKALMLYAGRDATEEFLMLHDRKVIQKYAADTVIGRVKA